MRERARECDRPRLRLVAARASAAFEGRDDLVRQRSIEILWHAQFPGEDAETALSSRADEGPQASHRFARTWR